LPRLLAVPDPRRGIARKLLCLIVVIESRIEVELILLEVSLEDVLKVRPLPRVAQVELRDPAPKVIRLVVKRLAGGLEFLEMFLEMQRLDVLNKGVQGGAVILAALLLPHIGRELCGV